MTFGAEPAVALVTGISASGKSTVAELLARRFDRGVHVRGDMFRRMIVAGREEMGSASPSEEAMRQLRLRYRLGAMAADVYFAAGFSVVVQDIVLGPMLQAYVDLLASRPLHVVVLAPRADVVAAREAARPKTAYRPGLLGADHLDAALRNETPRLGLWLDTSDQTPEETVDLIVHRWDAARVA
jgi:chloramphenicol 3-O-phosphotransferase